MDNLPSTITQHIYIYIYVYGYDNSCNIKFDKVLKQMMAHCFIYNCHKCFKPWNNCYCYCSVCKTHLKFCQQIYYDELSTYEDELGNVIGLSG